MLDKLKQQPLLTLTLAITAAFVLAHVINRAIDLTYEDALGSDPTKAAVWLFAIALTGLAAWTLPRFYRSRRSKLDLKVLSRSSFKSRGHWAFAMASVASVMILGLFVVFCIANAAIFSR